MAGLAGFAGAFGGNPAGAYQDSRKKQQGLDQGDVDAQGQAAAGNFVGMFGQQQTPGAPPGGAGMPGQPQQAPQQQQHGLGGLLQGLLQKLQGAGGGGPPGGMPQAPMQSAAVPGARPMMPSQGGLPTQGAPQPSGPGMAAMPPSSASMPGQPQGAPGAPQGQPQQGGGMTWQSVFQGVARANPGVKDPRVLMAAVNQLTPIMNSQSLMDWRQQQANLRGFTAETGRERADTSKDQGDRRLTDTENRDAAVQDRFLTREGRFDRQAAAKADQQLSMLQMQRQRLGAQIAANKDRTMVGQWRALLQAEQARERTILQSPTSGLSAAGQKKLLADSDTFYDGEIKKLRGQLDGGDKPKGSMVGKPGEEIVADKPAATKVASPEEAAKLKPGTRYTTPDGTEYTR